MPPRFNPLALLAVCAVMWASVLIAHRATFSAGVLLVALVCAPRRIPMVVALALPMFLSLLIVHAPHGDAPVALSLGLRAGALIATLLADMAQFSAADLVKSLQSAGISPKLTYIVGSAVSILPIGKRYADIYNTQLRLAGHHSRFGIRTRITRVIFPLITRMLVLSTEREAAVHTQGVLFPASAPFCAPLLGDAATARSSPYPGQPLFGQQF